MNEVFKTGEAGMWAMSGHHSAFKVSGLISKICTRLRVTIASEAVTLIYAGRTITETGIYTPEKKFK